MKIIHGEHATYFTQRDNEETPNRSCGITSAVNALVALGYALPAGNGQPEDRLMRFIRHDSVCLKMYDAKDKGKAPINEWQDILAAGISRWIGIPDLAFFIERATAAQIFTHIQGGGACLVTGEFPNYKGNTLHHTVALIGYEFFGEESLAAIAWWFLRDSWGDHRTLYTSSDGRLVDLKPEEFTSRLKKVGADAKWSIFIKGKR